MIDISNLTVKYGSPTNETLVLDNINLSLSRGEICAIIGPSGCGKSTLLHVLSGINRKYSGQALIDNSPINPGRHRIGLIPQNFGLLEWETVYNNSVLGLELKRESLNGYQEHIENVLEKLGLSELRGRYPSQISGGQRQRVSIARSFILNPDILLMDEPFSALDAITREETQDLFIDLWKSNNVTTLFVTHSIEEALYIGKKIVILSPCPGRIIKVLDNPVFGVAGLRFKKEFYELSMDFRKTVKEEWSK